MSRSTADPNKRGSATASSASGWQKPIYSPSHLDHHSDEEEEDDSDSDDPNSSNNMQEDDDDDNMKDGSDSDSDAGGGGSSRHHLSRRASAAARREREVEEEIARRRRELQKQKEREEREAAAAAAARAKSKEEAAKQAQQQKIPVSKLNLNAAVSATTTSAANPIPAPQTHPSGMQCIAVPSTSHTLQVVPLIAFAPPPGHHSSSSTIPAIGRAVVKHTQEISFNDMIQLSYITFRNYYTQFLTIKQMVVKPVPGDREGRSKQVWTTILHRLPLMTNPHAESDAQKYCLVSVEQFNHSKFQPQNLHRFRFEYYQSSPNWKSFSLNEIQFWCVSIPAALSNKDEEDERRSVRRPTSGLNALGRLAAVPQSVLDKLDSPSAHKNSASNKNEPEIEGSVHSILNMFPSTNKTRISTSSTIRARIEEVLATMNFDM